MFFASKTFIKVEELRLGNNILMICFDGQRRENHLNSNNNLMVYIDKAILIDVIHNPDAYAPIGISAEILKAAGFFPCSQTFFSMRTDIEYELFVTINKDRSARVTVGDGKVAFNFPLVYSIHQLQNIFFSITRYEIRIPL